MRWVIFVITLLSFISLVLLTDFTVWELISVTLFIFILLKFLDDLGKQISILDIPVLLACLTWLVMPIVFYHFYTRQDYMTNLWRMYMPIDADEYFSFVVPATIMMWIGLKVRFTKNEYDRHPEKFLINLKATLVGRSRIGFILLTIGLISGFVMLLVPSGLRQIFYFGKLLSYVGMFYIFFSDFARKRVILISVFLMVMLQSAASGLFGELVYLLIISLILITLNIKIRFGLKLAVCLLGMFFILVIQSLKIEYREKTWKKGGGNISLFGQLAVKYITEPSAMFQTKRLFKTSVRLNQGWLIARTMDYVPRKLPFANGETIEATLASVIVPRFLWPEKREVGGAYNLKRFWGYNLRGYSMDIGAIGEGYGNFGVTGGIIFIFFYGLAFNLLLRVILKKTQTHPTYLCWLPLLFMNSVQVETDMLNTINSLLKGLVFMWLMYWSFKTFFKIRL